MCSGIFTELNFGVSLEIEQNQKIIICRVPIILDKAKNKNSTTRPKQKCVYWRKTLFRSFTNRTIRILNSV